MVVVFGWVFARPITYEEFVGLWLNRHLRAAAAFEGMSWANPHGPLPSTFFDALADSPEDAKAAQNAYKRDSMLAQAPGLKHGR